MRNLILIASVMILMSSCSTVSTQKFIDVDETVEVKAGMSKSEMLELLGSPMEVRAGIIKKDGAVVEKWLYEHKTQMFEVATKQVNKMKLAKNQRPYEWVNAPFWEEIKWQQD